VVVAVRLPFLGGSTVAHEGNWEVLVPLGGASVCLIDATAK
jgi:hypothetical protein